MLIKLSNYKNLFTEIDDDLPQDLLKTILNRSWHANIMVRGRQLHRTFKTKDEAIAQRLAWEAMFNAAQT